MVAAADVPDECLQLRAVRRALAGLLLGEGLVALPHHLELPGEVLAGRGHPEVRDALPWGPMCSVHVLDPSRDMCQNARSDLLEQERFSRDRCRVWLYPYVTTTSRLITSPRSLGCARDEYQPIAPALIVHTSAKPYRGLFDQRGRWRLWQVSACSFCRVHPFGAPQGEQVNYRVSNG